MAGFVGSIEKITEKNKYFRKVLHTGKHLQLVAMSLGPKEEIGREVHKGVDQFFRVEEGRAKFVFGAKEVHLVAAGGAVVVPAGTYHNVINTSAKEPLKLYTIYTPPNHKPGTVHRTKAAAEAAEHPAVRKAKPKAKPAAKPKAKAKAKAKPKARPRTKK